MDFASPIGGDDLVHEIEEFDAPASFVMAVPAGNQIRTC